MIDIGVIKNFSGHIMVKKPKEPVMTQNPPPDRDQCPPEGIDTTAENKHKALVQEILLSLLRIEQNIKKIDSLLDQII